MKLIDWVILILLLAGNGWIGWKAANLINLTGWVQSWLI